MVHLDLQLIVKTTVQVKLVVGSAYCCKRIRPSMRVNLEATHFS